MQRPASSSPQDAASVRRTAGYGTPNALSRKTARTFAQSAIRRACALHTGRDCTQISGLGANDILHRLVHGDVFDCPLSYPFAVS